MTTHEHHENRVTAEAILAAYRGDEGAGLDSLERLLHDDVVTTDWMYPGETLVGRAAFVERVLVEAGAAFPDATEEIVSSTFDGETLVVRANFRGTFSGPYYGVSPHFGPLHWQIVDHWHIRDGRIVEIAFAADTAEAWRQVRTPGR
jgi:predicted ester cyclase